MTDPNHYPGFDYGVSGRNRYTSLTNVHVPREAPPTHRDGNRMKKKHASDHTAWRTHAKPLPRIPRTHRHLPAPTARRERPTPTATARRERPEPTNAGTHRHRHGFSGPSRAPHYVDNTHSTKAQEKRYREMVKGRPSEITREQMHAARVNYGHVEAVLGSNVSNDAYGDARRNIAVEKHAARGWLDAELEGYGYLEDDRFGITVEATNGVPSPKYWSAVQGAATKYRERTFRYD